MQFEITLSLTVFYALWQAELLALVEGKRYTAKIRRLRPELMAVFDLAVCYLNPLSGNTLPGKSVAEKNLSSLILHHLPSFTHQSFLDIQSGTLWTLPSRSTTASVTLPVARCSSPRNNSYLCSILASVTRVMVVRSFKRSSYRAGRW
jgi:hypothetical protein